VGVLKINKMLCPKCKEVICVPTHKDFIICPKCNEVIHVIFIPILDETHDRKAERKTDNSN
jgi:hypothetical protein